MSLHTIYHKSTQGWVVSWWRHQMETFFALLAICAGNPPVPGEFPTQMPVTRCIDVYFDMRPNKRLSKQSWGWWIETPSRPLWRHRNVLFCYVNMDHPHSSVLLLWRWGNRKSTTLRWLHNEHDGVSNHCLGIVCSVACSGTDQRKYQRSASLAFVWGIHRWPVNSPDKWPVTRKMFPSDDAVMSYYTVAYWCYRKQ